MQQNPSVASLATRVCESGSRWPGCCYSVEATNDQKQPAKSRNMLRITVQIDSQPVTIQLEGRLTGPWLEELAKCWNLTLSTNREPNIRVDLTELTFVDSAGKEYLKTMHRQGAQFVTADYETKCIVDEITSKQLGVAQ
jgi:hypothetical protein